MSGAVVGGLMTVGWAKLYWANFLWEILGKLLVGKVGLFELLTTQSLKIVTFLDVKHLHSGCIADAASFCSG